VGNTAFLMKRAGHLLSKMRFVSAQLEGYLNNDVWLKMQSMQMRWEKN
jgi:threonine aldolase